jgi:lysozyme
MTFDSAPASARRRWPYAVAAGLLLLVTLAALAWYVLLPQYRPGLNQGERYGIDVSNHQGVVDWEAVAADHITFAYLKATEGGDFVDQRFAPNWDAAAAAGLERGAYHFFTLCRPGAEQAANFLAVAPPDPTALAPAVDLELSGNCSARPSPESLIAELEAFLAPVERAWGRKALLYTNDEFDDRYPVRALGRDLWEATYYRRPSGEQWTIWQVTSLAAVNGVAGRVDLDLMRRPK